MRQTARASAIDGTTLQSSLAAMIKVRVSVAIVFYFLDGIADWLPEQAEQPQATGPKPDTVCPKELGASMQGVKRRVR